MEHIVNKRGIFKLTWYSSLLQKHNTNYEMVETENGEKEWLESEEHSPYCEWRWNDKDCGKDLVLHRNKLGVTFHPSKSSGCVVVRGDNILKANMEHYFEVELRGPFHGKARQVGIGTKHTSLQSNNCDFYPLIGKDLSSWGVNYDGFKSNAGRMQRHVSIDPEKHDVIRIGVHYDSYYGTLGFEVNGHSSGLAFGNIHTNIDMYPMLCGSAAGTKMRMVCSKSSVMSLKAISRGVIRSSLAREKDVEKLILPPYLKRFLLYQTSTNNMRNTSKRKYHGSLERNNVNCHESTI